MCEFISAGGLYRAVLPATLRTEGERMRDALLHDLLALQDDADCSSGHGRLQLFTTLDPRCTAPAIPFETIPLDADVWQCWQQAIAAADAVWLIAPESDGSLLRLTEQVEQQGKRLLGCPAAGVRLASSKRQTWQRLHQAGIAAIPTLTWAQFEPGLYPAVVAKPDDGAGCEDSACFDDHRQLKRWMHGREHSHVLQPYQPGLAASMSLLCRAGRAWLLSCNWQKVSLHSDATAYRRFHYRGSVVNGAAAHWDVFDALAQRVAQAMPELGGYIGVDVIVADDAVWVVEINPRLTTSYAGLHQAMGCNPAGLLLDFTYNDDFLFPDIKRHPVDISLYD
ncbi:ATP-grasp domain-containing protein [Methylobacillus flagellatus]|uniref:ATP-grasp domain-containing protein n=1 Tax=Methylobacillus flagellatus TaxID=405 RepID=UPI002570D25C|nr:ATP-grasp domain-containing protein [Methylobacillus flagellatus]